MVFAVAVDMYMNYWNIVIFSAFKSTGSNDLNVSDDFVVIAVSGMASDQVISGCSYGGCAIYCRNQLSVSFSPCPVVSKRFCSGEILLADGRLLLLVCVYFPYDNGSQKTSTSVHGIRWAGGLRSALPLCPVYLQE